MATASTTATKSRPGRPTHAWPTPTRTGSRTATRSRRARIPRSEREPRPTRMRSVARTQGAVEHPGCWACCSCSSARACCYGDGARDRRGAPEVGGGCPHAVDEAVSSDEVANPALLQRSPRTRLSRVNQLRTRPPPSDRRPPSTGAHARRSARACDPYRLREVRGAGRRPPGVGVPGRARDHHRIRPLASAPGAGRAASEDTKSQADRRSALNVRAKDHPRATPLTRGHHCVQTRYPEGRETGLGRAPSRLWARPRRFRCLTTAE